MNWLQRYYNAAEQSSRPFTRITRAIDRDSADDVTSRQESLERRRACG